MKLRSLLALLAPLVLAASALLTQTAPANIIISSGPKHFVTDDAGPLDPEADFLTRSTQPGVFYAQGFDYSTRAQLINSAAKVRDGWVGAPDGATPEDPPPGGASAKVDLDTSIKVSGTGSMKQRFVDGEENLTQAGPSYAGSFDGVGETTESTSKTVFYMQWAMRFNQKWLDTPHTQPGATNTKLMNIDGVDTGFGAGQTGFLSVARDPRLPGGWTVRGSSGFKRYQNNWNIGNPPGDGEGQLHTFVNLGPVVDGALTDESDENHWQRRYGPTRNQVGSWNSVYDHDNYPIQFHADTWYVIEYKIDLTNDEVKVWFAEYGEAPILFTGFLNANFTSTQEWTGFQAMFRPTDGTDTVFSGDDLARWIDEIIISDDPIEYPGGFSLPYSGTGEAPAGYPYGGSAEDNT